MVDSFYMKNVDSVGNSTQEHTTHHPPHKRSLSQEENFFRGNTNTIITSTPNRRTSSREIKQRAVVLTPKAVRYDMELVPRVVKNVNFSPTKPQITEAPFFTSVIWRPRKRKDWEDCLSELVAVCTSAGLRKYLSSPPPSGKKRRPPFVPPLSREYIRDRIDIDDPLRGVQVRHTTQGWLQGFLLWTTFTTWTHFFAWDSLHDLSGLAKSEYRKDTSGDLARELQSLPRTGNPQDSGVIFGNVAEIALLGGLGCGELLLRMALEEIRRSGQYDYVVLQATVGSRSFYERFGFVRVGAVCRYGDQGKLPTLDTAIQGYRHWTHANESQKSLDMHGGPSYMMCLKLDKTRRGTSLLKVMEKYTVTARQKIEATPMTPTPNKGRRLKRSNSTTIPPDLPNLTPTSKRFYTDMSELQPHGPAKKKRRSSSTDLTTPPPTGIALTYAEKQYQSVWLAVPPSSAQNSRQRKPPRSRSSPKQKYSSKNQNVKKCSQLLPNSSPDQKQVVPSDKIQKIDRSSLCKQKVKSYPRDRLHFYNKVVVQKSQPNKYYFVLHYNESKSHLVLVPMTIQGTLSGRRQGRPRFQCLLKNTSSNWLNVSSKNYVPVSAFMVMKTPIVAQEAWDILAA
jgi:predicted GNAT family N-acyltransferase